MATVNTWTWTINSMQQWPSGANAGYVVNVQWTLTGTDGTPLKPPASKETPNTQYRTLRQGSLPMQA